MTVDTLEEYGMVRTSDEEIRGFLSSQRVGILGLPTEGPPVMRPMSFWYDGADTVYFLYVLGSSSRKAEVSDRADAARLLVYSADTAFNWTSVLLTGTISDVPEGERDAVEDAMEMRWRPDVFERASASENTALYRFHIEEQTGLKHLGLPPGLEEGPSADRSA